MQKQPIAILGAGNMATALAIHLAKQGHNLYLYCIEPDVEKQINEKHRNDKYLAGVHLPNSIHATGKIAECVQGARLIIVSVPSGVLTQVINLAKPYLRKDAIVALTSKGFDSTTLEPIVLTAQKTLPAGMRQRVCLLGGPAVATEMAKGTPMAFVIAGHDAKARQTVAKLITSHNIKAAQSNDLLGVGLAAALKNAYAIALGFCDGLKYDTNAKAFVITLAVNEMAGLMLKADAHPKTASSLAGLGDLLVTGLSPHGRNRQYGASLVRSQTNDPKRLGLTTVEGIAAADLGVKLAKKLGAQTPLLTAINQGIHAKTKYYQPFVNYVQNIKLGLI